MRQTEKTFLKQWLVALVIMALFGLVITAFVAPTETKRAVSIASIRDVANVGDSQFPWNAQLSAGPAPQFEFKTRDGQIARLSDYRGQVIFLNFWATNCEPCRKEIPDLSRLAKKMEGLPFKILAVTTDTDWALVDQMFPTKGEGVELGMDPRQTSLIKSLYGTDKIPESYIIDKKGELRMRFVNVHPWDDERLHRFLEVLANES